MGPAPPARPARLLAATAFAALLMFAATPRATAQTQTAVAVPEAGHGSVGMSFQYSKINQRTIPESFGGGLENFGEITLRSAWLELDYGLTDRLAVSAWVPFKSNRYSGDTPHDPIHDLDDDHGERFLDDGHYHASWGDWGLGLRWQWRTQPVAITPFVSFHYPMRDYPLFTETQAGTGQWRLDLGVNAGARFPGALRNVYWQAGYAYSYMERTEPYDAPARRVNHGTLNLELGWLVSPTTTLRANYAYRKTFNGLTFPEEFNLPPRGDQFYFHDQLFPWESATASVGASWQVGDRWAVVANWGRTVDITWGHKYRSAVSVGVSRSF
jgi:hypothetical protein